MPATKKTRAAAPTPVPLRDVEKELSRRLRVVHGAGESPVLRACMSNLVIYCDSQAAADEVGKHVPTIVALHPARVLLLIAEPGAAGSIVEAAVQVRGHVVEPDRWVVSEEIILHAAGQGVECLPSAVRALLIGDLPTSLWWAIPQPPSLAGERLFDLVDHAEQIIYDSIGWREPARGVVATAAWLPRIERGPGQGRWRVAADLNWRRLKYWRRLLAQSLDPATNPGALEGITDVLLEHGPHAVVQAWELVSWLASRLKWEVAEGCIQPGIEICWQLKAAHGPVCVRIRRLEAGPPEVRHLRIAFGNADRVPALNLAVAEEERRLAAVPESAGALPRTVTVPPQPLAEMIASQLADRERDPVFRESMAVAQVLARSVLRT